MNRLRRVRSAACSLLMLAAAAACSSAPSAGSPPPSASDDSPAVTTTPAPTTVHHRRPLFPARYADASLSSRSLHRLAGASVKAGQVQVSLKTTAPQHGTLDIVVACRSGPVAVTVNDVALETTCAGRLLDVITRPASGQLVTVDATVSRRQSQPWGVAVYRVP